MDRLNCQRNRRQNRRVDVLETKRGHGAQCYKINRGTNWNKGVECPSRGHWWPEQGRLLMEWWAWKPMCWEGLDCVLRCDWGIVRDPCDTRNHILLLFFLHLLLLQFLIFWFSLYPQVPCPALIRIWRPRLTRSQCQKQDQGCSNFSVVLWAQASDL